MVINYSDIETIQIYKLMSSTITPRPIAWIVTEDGGVINIAPFSYFTPLSSEPACVVVSIGLKDDDSPKDTLSNIRKNKKATICLVNLQNLEKMNLSSTALDKSQSEAVEFNISTEKILDDYPPIIKDIESALFCDFMQEIELGGETTPVVLKIKAQFLQNVDEKLNTVVKNIGRVGREYLVDYTLIKAPKI